MTCRQIYIVQQILIARVCMANTYYTCVYGKYLYMCMYSKYVCIHGFVWQIYIRVFAIANTSVGNATFCADCRAGFAAHGIVIPNCIVKALRQFCSMYMNVYINVYIYECKLIHISLIKLKPTHTSNSGISFVHVTIQLLWIIYIFQHRFKSWST